MTSPPYGSRYAQLYDLFYGDKEYGREVDAIERLVAHHGDGSSRRIVDLACGTGGHALELARRGHEVVGVDASPDMLTEARTRAAAAGLDVAFVCEDLRSFASQHPFDVAVCLFDSIGYVRTNAGLGEALGAVRDLLRPGGLFLTEYWHAAAMVRSFSPVGVRRWTTDAGEVVRVSETRLDVRSQLAHVSYQVLRPGEQGGCEAFTETHVNRYFLVQEMAAWLDRYGLTPLDHHAGYDLDADVDADTWHILSVARRER